MLVVACLRDGYHSHIYNVEDPWGYIVGKDWMGRREESKTPTQSIAVTQIREIITWPRIVAESRGKWTDVRTIYKGHSTGICNNKMKERKDKMMT